MKNNLTIDSGTTGLTLDEITLQDISTTASSVTIDFTGTAAAGSLRMTPHAEALVSHTTGAAVTVEIPEAPPIPISDINSVFQTLLLEGTFSVVPDATIASLMAVGGEGTITYSLALGDGSNNNDQFKISDNEVQVNSVDLTEGTYSFRVKGEDSEGSSFEKSFIAVVVAQPKLPVNFVAVLANGFNDTETTTELTLLFTSDPTTLAAGDITVTGADKGNLSGTGAVRNLEISNIDGINGDEVTVTLMSPAGYDIMPSSRNVVVFVKTEAPIALDTTPPLAGEVGVFYEGSFETTGGTGPYSYTVTSGEIPTGLNLSVNGELSGTPTVAGAFTFTVTVNFLK